ncbi:MAG: DUF86 domain-containing protein [Acidobacteria bacterium]|nr:DUF86 domain-containing protein [Acidobacteriota bacterium]
MVREVIEQKLDSLRRCIDRVAQKCPADAETLRGDLDLQDIVALNLTRAVQLCVDLGAHVLTSLDVRPPQTMGQTFDALAAARVIPETLAARLKKSVGFRNIAVHNYEAIDWAIVHSIARNHLVDFTDFARAIASRIP